MVVQIYSDGSCLGNPGPGGYGTIAYDEDLKPLCKASMGFELTTNNRMECLGLMQALIISAFLISNQKKDGMPSPIDSIEIYVDSRYVLDAYTKNLENWKARDWKIQSGKTAKNMDLWKEIDRWKSYLDTLNTPISISKVKAHDGHQQNESVDALAKRAAKEDNHHVDTGYVNS